jgi:hypothetical protein
MQVSKHLRTLGRSIITFMHVQLFITLISMPILLCWGMPLSWLSFAGNFFFGPILTVFLLLSSLIFFFQLLAIPNGILIYALEKLTHFWMMIMHLPSCQSLVALPKPPLAIAFIIACIAVLILHCRQIDTPLKGIAAYSFILVISGLFLTFTTRWSAPVQTLSCHSGEVTLLYHHKQLALIDPGVIGQRISAPNWCEYTLVPFLAKEYGTTKIDCLIALQPNGVLFDALHHLLDKIEIKKIYLPYWEGKLPAHWWRSYYKFTEQCKKTGCTLIRLTGQDLRSVYIGTELITINPLDSRIVNHEYTFPAFAISGTILDHKIDLFSRKYKKS